jgi:hypothetical protein
MEAILSAIMSDLLSRALSMVIQRYKSSRAEEAEHKIQRLKLVLLQVDSMVEAAEGRQITNQATIRQLEMLRQGMYGGHYMLDTVNYRGHDEMSGGLHVALPRFSSAKRLPSFPGSSSNGNRQSTESLKTLEKMLDGLETMVSDMLEFAVFSRGYPRICRQPYGTYLILGNVMFGRQHVRLPYQPPASTTFLSEQISHQQPASSTFLSEQTSTSHQPPANRTESPAGNGNPGVLPIVGAPRIGKSTLIEHVCLDGRVRTYFSSIVLFTGEDLAAFRGSAVIKHQDVTAPCWEFRKTRHPRNVKFDKVLKTCFSGTGSSRFSEAWNLRSLRLANM